MIFTHQDHISQVSTRQVTNRLTRSTVEIKVGVTRHGADRLEVRHISDIKVAHLREGAGVAERPILVFAGNSNCLNCAKKVH